MPSEESKALLERLERVREAVGAYFRRVAPVLGQADYEFDAVKYRAKLPPDIRQHGEELVREIIELAADASAAAKRSPMLSEADAIEVGHAAKGMRAAVRLADYEYWDPQVLHDEGTVLGVRPAGQSEWRAAGPTKAFEAFETWARRLQAVLELVGVGLAEGRVSIAGSGLSAPAGYRPATAFIMMSMQSTQPDLTDVSDTVKRCFAKFGITALRADDIEHEDVITKRILDEIRTSEFLFADLSGERPSVYYEVGYAHALGRRAMLFRKAGTVIHFDLAAYNCPEYQNLRELDELLTRRLEYATGQQPREAAVSPRDQHPDTPKV